jgi:hypothetical protein
MMVKLSEAVAIVMAQVPGRCPRDPAIPPDARSSTSRRGGEGQRCDKQRYVRSLL